MINAHVNTELENYIVSTIEKKTGDTERGVFTADDFAKYNETHGETPITDVFTILLNNRRLKNVDRVGGKIYIVLN